MLILLLFFFLFWNFSFIQPWITTNTNIFDWKISAIYEYILFEISTNYKYSSVWRWFWIIFGFWKAANNLIFEYIRSQLFKYIWILNYSLTSEAKPRVVCARQFNQNQWPTARRPQLAVFRAIKIISPPIVVVSIGPTSNLWRRREQLLEKIFAAKSTVFTFAATSAKYSV